MAARVSSDIPSDVVRGNYFERELSWLDFNSRVLGLAGDRSLPLLERVKFLAIFATNLDEFFQIRVASLKDRLAASQESGSSLVEPLRNLGAVARRTRAFVASHDQAYYEVLRELASAGVELVPVASLGDDDRGQLSKVFEADVLPVLTPLAVDAAHPFPYISNLSLDRKSVV